MQFIKWVAVLYVYAYVVLDGIIVRLYSSILYI